MPSHTLPKRDSDKYCDGKGSSYLNRQKALELDRSSFHHKIITGCGNNPWISRGQRVNSNQAYSSGACNKCKILWLLARS